jgi:hypothetical protein
MLLDNGSGGRNQWGVCSNRSWRRLLSARRNEAFSRRVRSALRVLPHTGIRIHPCCVVLEQVGLGEATTDWIIITRPIVEQAGFAVQALAGEGVDRETEGKGFGAASSNYLNSSK